MPPQRRYICSFCARPFSRSEHKARHERSHTKEKPFHCHQCESSFVRRDLLQRHLRTVHAKDKLHLQKQVHHKEETAAAVATTVAQVPQREVVAENFNYKDIFHYNDQTNVISLLTLSKRFESIPSPSSKSSSIFLTWATISNNKLPIVSNDQLGSMSSESNLLYALLAFGSIDLENNLDCIHFIQKSWGLILKQQFDHDQIIQALTIIAYIYLEHYHSLKNFQADLIPIEIIMDYLDQNIMKCLSSSSNCLFNYWFVFNILSKFSFQYNKSPAKCHSIFLTKKISNHSNCSLSSFLQNLSISSNSFPKAEANDLDSLLSQEIIIYALANELQSIRFNTPNEYHSREVLHNSIIMVNKAFNSSSQTSHSSLVEISKKSLLLNCPLKFQDLLTDYITPPTLSIHWFLLQITLREFNMEYNPTCLSHLHQLSSQQATITLTNYLNNLRIGKIVNNLGITGFVVLFLGFLKIPINDELQNSIDFKIFIVENFMILIKIIEGFEINNGSRVNEWDNPIIQCLNYIISEMGVTNSSSSSSFEQATMEMVTNLKKNLELNFKNWLHLLKFNEIWQIDDISNSIFDHHSIISPLGSHVNSPNSNNYIIDHHDQYSKSFSHQMYRGGSMSSVGSNSGYNNENIGMEKIKLPPINVLKQNAANVGNNNGRIVSSLPVDRFNW